MIIPFGDPPDPHRPRSAAGGAPTGPRRLARQPDEVTAALGRLANDTFARCEVCGVQISQRRLHIAPAADRCANHLLFHHYSSDSSPGRAQQRQDQR